VSSVGNSGNCPNCDVLEGTHYLDQSGGPCSYGYREEGAGTDEFSLSVGLSENGSADDCEWNEDYQITAGLWKGARDACIEGDSVGFHACFTAPFDCDSLGYSLTINYDVWGIGNCSGGSVSVSP
jgi:hypothetical protein